MATATGHASTCCSRPDGSRPRGRRKAPGRPITYGTTEVFLSHFGLEEVGDLPGLDELKGSGLLDGRPASRLCRADAVATI